MWLEGVPYRWQRLPDVSCKHISQVLTARSISLRKAEVAQMRINFGCVALVVRHGLGGELVQRTCPLSQHVHIYSSLSSCSQSSGTVQAGASFEESHSRFFSPLFLGFLSVIFFGVSLSCFAMFLPQFFYLPSFRTRVRKS